MKYTHYNFNNYEIKVVCRLLFCCSEVVFYYIDAGFSVVYILLRMVNGNRES